MSSNGKRPKGMTRRDFFKGAAVAGAAVAGAGAFAKYTEARGGSKPPKRIREFKGIPIPMEKLNTYGETLETQLLLRSSPIAIKMLKDESEIPDGAFRPRNDKGEHYALCQAFALARRQRSTIAMFIADHWCFEPIIGLGLVEPPQSFLDGMTAGFFISDPEAAAKHAQEAPRLPHEKYEGSGMVFGPATTVNFSPDLVMIYCNSGQLRYMLLALGYKEGYMVNSEFYAIGSCTRAMVPPLLTHEGQITVPDPGERDRAMTGEDMMILTLPAKAWPVGKGQKRNLFEDLMYGINTLSNWLPYKTSFSPSMQPNFKQPPFYEQYFAEWGLDGPYS